MHRHGYVGRKFSRECDQQDALIKGLATSLVMHGKIETTLPKAKELVRYIEKIITKAKIGGLHNRRQVITALDTQEAAFKLFDVIAPQLTSRTSGHVRVKRTALRVGDGTQMATIAFVDDIESSSINIDSEKIRPSKPSQKAKEDTPKTTRKASSVAKAKEDKK
ncbi:MAG TPA: 50S ribosomal protein L17 [Candidatus Angelobacter sp.]|nr:50S ribosomal protein L17 [Candidatus Angelobacter sp.]